MAELVLHPVRLRILHAVNDGAPFSTSALCERLKGVSKATVYRQVALLAAGGLLETESENRVRGAVERIYRLQPSKAAMSLTAIAAMTNEEHRSGFASAIAALVAEFNIYLERDCANPLKDSVSYRQFSIWLSEEEKAALIKGVFDAVREVAANKPSSERRKHLFSTILFPTDTR